MNTVTYGTAPAPFLATRCLYQLEFDNEILFPTACNVIKHHIYGDDLLTGAETIQAAIDLHNKLNHIVNTAGLEFRKCASNDPRILSDKNRSLYSVFKISDK